MASYHHQSAMTLLLLAACNGNLVHLILFFYCKGSFSAEAGIIMRRAVKCAASSRASASIYFSVAGNRLRVNEEAAIILRPAWRFSHALRVAPEMQSINLFHIDYASSSRIEVGSATHLVEGEAASILRRASASACRAICRH